MKVLQKTRVLSTIVFRQGFGKMPFFLLRDFAPDTHGYKCGAGKLGHQNFSHNCQKRSMAFSNQVDDHNQF